MIDLTVISPLPRDHQITMKLTKRLSLPAHGGLSLPAHGAIEFAAGLVMMFAPAVLSFAPLAFIASATLGAILAGAALTLTSDSRSATDRVPDVAAHSNFDTAFVVAVAMAAVGLAVAGQRAAVVLLAAVVVVHVSLSFTTRYATAD